MNDDVNIAGEFYYFDHKGAGNLGVTIARGWADGSPIWRSRADVHNDLADARYRLASLAKAVASMEELLRQDGER
jgi:hypothetical protein